MSKYLLAALGALTFGMLSTGSASAAWQDTIFGTNAFSKTESRPARAVRSGGEERAPRRTRTARVDSYLIYESPSWLRRSQRHCV